MEEHDEWSFTRLSSNKKRDREDEDDHDTVLRAKKLTQPKIDDESIVFTNCMNDINSTDLFVFGTSCYMKMSVAVAKSIPGPGKLSIYHYLNSKTGRMTIKAIRDKDDSITLVGT